MEMTVTFDSLSEARDWAAELLGYPIKTITGERPNDEVHLEYANTPDESTGTVIKVNLENDDRTKGLGKRQKEVLDLLLLKAGTEMSTGEIAASVGITSPAVSGVLSKLATKGLAISPKRGKWVYLSGDVTLDVTNEEPVAVAEVTVEVEDETLPPEPSSVLPSENVNDLLDQLEI